MARIHSLLARLPVSGADLTVLIDMLESLNEAEGLLRATANGQIIDARVAQITGLVDNESATEGDSTIRREHTVVLRNLLGQVGQHGDVHVTEATSRTRLLGVLHVREVGVDRAGDELAVGIMEMLGGVVEGADLRGAHEGEIERIEEEHDVLAGVVSQLDLLEGTLSPGHTAESGSGQRNTSLRVGDAESSDAVQDGHLSRFEEGKSAQHF